MSRNVLIVYYSLEGNTEALVNAIQPIVNADVLKLSAKKEINPKGFMKYVWGGRQAVMKKLPELMPYDVDLEQYDTIIVGTPVWASTISPPIRSFFTENRVTGKDIAFFCTHEGGPGKTLENFKALMKDNRVMMDLDIKSPLKNIETATQTIINWVKKLV